jgi:alkylated DNA nucleotide flippase Atl1
MQNTSKNVKAQVFEVVGRIPERHVAYFGQIAAEVGIGARTVGWILSGMTQKELPLIPWYRVVAKTGFISSVKLGYKGQIQKEMLEQEGVEVTDGHVDMARYGVDKL